MPEAGHQVRRTDTEEFLARVERVPVLLGEASRRRYALDVSQQQAAGREWKDAFHLVQPQRWKADFRQARRDRSCHRYAIGGEADRLRSYDREHHDTERHRSPRQQPPAGSEQRDSEQTNHDCQRC